MDMDTLFFFDGRPAAMEIYTALEEKLRAAFPDVRVKVQKTQISFGNKYGFAFASLPRRKNRAGSKDYLIVSFGLGAPVESPRIFVKTEAYRNRWTHHVEVSSAEELDGELMGWIREAYEFSAAK